MYRAWFQWASSIAAKDMQVLSRKVVGVKGEKAAMCSPESVKTYFDSLQETLLEIGVLKSAGETVQNEHRVWACDEKGMTDDDGKIKFVQSLCVKGQGAPTCTAGQSSFKHVSVLPFICLNGDRSEPYVVMSGAVEMNAWKNVWGDAHVKVSSKGAVTTEHFAEFYAHFASWVRARVPVEEEILVLLIAAAARYRT